MNEEIERALQTDSLVDITTTGKKTGKPHKIEIAFHYLDQDIYISGMPGRRDWYANLVANPEFTFTLSKAFKLTFLQGLLRFLMKPKEGRSWPGSSKNGAGRTN